MHVFAFIILVVTSAASASAEDAETVRVATFNVNFGNTRGDLVLRAIADADADVICLQETTPQSERFLKTELAGKYPEFHAVGHRNQFYAERFVFVSRTAPRDLEFVEPDEGLFGFWSATFRVGERDVRIVNVHLTPFVFSRGSSVMGIMAAVTATEECHRNEIQKVIQSLPSEMPVIVAGDFNSLSTFVAPQAMVARGFVDSFASTHTSADAHPTWQWPTRPLPLKLRIDYIFHTTNLQTQSSRVIGPTGSDHMLLVSALKFSEQGGAPECSPGCY